LVQEIKYLGCPTPPLGTVLQVDVAGVPGLEVIERDIFLLAITFANIGEGVGQRVALPIMDTRSE
jgi:hypothetical protein